MRVKNKRSDANFVKVSTKWHQRLREHEFKSKCKGKSVTDDEIAGRAGKYSIVIKRDLMVRKDPVMKRTVKVELPLVASKNSAGLNSGDQSQMSDKFSYSCGRTREVYDSEDDSARGGNAKTNASAIDKFLSHNGAIVTRQFYDAQSGK